MMAADIVLRLSGEILREMAAVRILNLRPDLNVVRLVGPRQNLRTVLRVRQDVLLVHHAALGQRLVEP